MIDYCIWNGSKKELIEHNELLNFSFKGRKIEPEYFYWKHLENPLGKSIITYAKHEGKIVGARALQPTLYQDIYFMQPCDTATHPDFQRRGVFSSLTKLALNQIDNNVVVINFPNYLSLQANRSAGWKYHEKIKPNIGLNPFKLAKSNRKLMASEIKSKLSMLKNEKWRGYCEWRFISNPRSRYNYFYFKGNLVIVNERRMSYQINLLDESCSTSDNRIIPFLYFSYNLDQKFNLFERLVHRVLQRGSNIASLRLEDLLVMSKRNKIELSGLMDTF